MKVLKWILIVIAVLVAAGFIFMPIAKNMTKKHSPEEIVHFVDGDLDIEVFYCRPFKKERQIFGDLVPYGVTWRTGANEATTFKTNKDLSINGEQLKAGEYTLWTVPNKDSWEVVWNDGSYDWGVDFSAIAKREKEHDALIINVPSQKRAEVLEQFTISFSGPDGLRMLLEWDDTVVEVPIQY